MSCRYTQSHSNKTFIKPYRHNQYMKNTKHDQNHYNHIHDNEKNHIEYKKKKRRNRLIILAIIKLLLISIFIYGYYHINNSFENQISLLAVSENQNGETLSGSIVKLNLKTKPGTGQVNVNLNTIQDIDTQISIINSHKIACDLFELECGKYDFHYDFEGSALLLKGPSASSAIAILTAKTINNIKISNDTVITGSLNSGGVIGIVGGIEEKVKTAKEKGFAKVLIPAFSQFNETEKYDIEIVKVLDIVEAYNQFNQDYYELKTYPINTSGYKKNMKILSEELCSQSNLLKTQINISNISNSSREMNYLKSGEKNYNYSFDAFENENYYSVGSFCYNANLNFRLIVESQKNLNIEEMDSQIDILHEKIIQKSNDINKKEYIETIKTINDFYVFLLLNDRLEEALDFIKEAKKNNLDLSKEYQQILIISNQSNNINITQNNTINISEREKELLERIENLKKQEEIRKEMQYSYAIERLQTVYLWEKIIVNSGNDIQFNNEIIENSCNRIIRELNIKSELLANYNVNIFDNEIIKINSYKSSSSNQYLCLYQGIELIGKINTMLNSYSGSDNETKEFTNKLLNFTYSRLTINSNGEFPLIPYIYYEYATELNKQGDSSSAQLYSNYALSYADLNLFLKKEEIEKNILIDNVITALFENPVFIVSMLLLIGFIR